MSQFGQVGPVRAAGPSVAAGAWVGGSGGAGDWPGMTAAASIGIPQTSQ